MTSTRCQRIGKWSHPKAFFEFWNLMSFHKNWVSAWCYNNPLKNRLMRWFVWVTLGVPHSTRNSRHNSLHWVPIYRHLQQGASCPFHPSVSVWGGWMGDKHANTICYRSMSPFCPVVVWNRVAICLSHWPSLLERQQRIIRKEQMMWHKPPAVWPLTMPVL